MLDKISKQTVTDGITLYRVPTPGDPLRNCNIFVVTSRQGNLLIDTGLRSHFFRNMLDIIIKDAKLKPQETKVIITHCHHDHYGQADYLSLQGMTVYTHREEKRIYQSMVDLKWVKIWGSILDNMGKTHEQQAEIMLEFGVDKVVPFPSVDLELGTVFTMDSLRFEVIDLSGHTYAHIGLYDSENKILFCGDHVLDDISPHVGFYHYGYDSLEVYKKNLLKLKDMSIDIALPGHRALLHDIDKRVDELIAHHSDRAAEVLQIIKRGFCRPLDITSRMRGFSVKGRFDEWGNFTQLFAVDEVMANLEHLVAQGLAQRELDERGLVSYYAL